jgi:hypothetical protein
LGEESEDNHQKDQDGGGSDERGEGAEADEAGEQYECGGDIAEDMKAAKGHTHDGAGLFAGG